MTDEEIARIKLLKVSESEILVEEARKYFCINCSNFNKCRKITTYPEQKKLEIKTLEINKYFRIFTCFKKKERLTNENCKF